MREFDYTRPEDLDGVLEILGDLRENAKVIAGGTDLIPQLREDLATPAYVIDISSLKELSFIREEDGFIRIGAATKMRTIEQSQLVRAKVPMFAEAAQLVGEIGVRTIATLGGNLVNASPAADSVPPLLTLDASVTIKSRKSERTIKLSAFFVDVKKTVLQVDEIVSEIRIPIPLPNSGGAFQRLAKRGGNVISIVSAAAFIHLDKGICKIARIAMGSVAPTPIRIQGVEKMLEDSELTDQRIRDAAEKVTESIKPISDVRASSEYRKDTSPVLVRRVIQAAYTRAKKE